MPEPQAPPPLPPSKPQTPAMGLPEKVPWWRFERTVRIGPRSPWFFYRRCFYFAWLGLAIAWTRPDSTVKVIGALVGGVAVLFFFAGRRQARNNARLGTAPA